MNAKDILEFEDDENPEYAHLDEVGILCPLYPRPRIEMPKDVEPDGGVGDVKGD